MVEKITNGLGGETTLDYEPLSTTDHYERLDVDTTSGTGTFCETLPGYGQFCFDRPVTVADSTSFYTAINGDWDLPTGSQTLGKNMPAIEFSGPYYVVTEVEGSSPAVGFQPGQVDASAMSKLSYRYGEAKLQAAGRGMLGFERLTTIDNQTGVETTTRYRQDWPFIGRPIATESKSEDGSVLSSSFTGWEIVEWSTNYKSTYQTQGSEAAGPVHVVQAVSVDQVYDLVSNGVSQGALLSSTETTATYDSAGNLTTTKIENKDASGTVIKSVETVNVYDSTTFDLHDARLLSSTVTTTRQGFATDLVRESSFEYYTSGAHFGLLKKEVIEPNQSAFKLETTHSYDAFGNRVRSKSVGGSETRCDVDVAVYDSTGRYVEQTRDCLGRTTSVVTARNEFGQATVVEKYIDTTDSVTYTTSYGALGRPYYAYNETGASTTTFMSTSNASCPAATALSETTTDAGGAVTTKCVDVVGRTIRELTVAFDGTWNAQDTEYDVLGRVQNRSEPFNLTHDGPMAPYWTTISYDILGRVTLTTLPDNSTGSMTYAGLVTTSTNDLGHTKTEHRNVLGETVDIYDNLGGRTQYDYDHQGNLVSVKDNANNTTTTAYDLLGRKTSVDDPNKGVWSYSYNHFGDLILQTDAKQQSTVMTYDGLGRMVTRKDKNALGTDETDTTWVYDTAPYGLGQLDHVTDNISGYHKAILYDTLGRPSEVVTSISGGVYFVKTTYDAYGRVYQAFDAAGNGNYTDFGIANAYNAHGYLESVGDAIEISGSPRTIYQKIEGMNARGQVTVEKRGIQQGNTNPAATVTYGYSGATGRLTDIFAVNAQGYEIQDLEYTWDTVGNLLTRKEFSGSKNLQESFGYDGLNRLTSYGVAGQTVTVTYDSQHLGNIVSKSDVSGTYYYGANGAGPNAVTSFDGSTYTYDNNGNNTTGGGRSISYTTYDMAMLIVKGAESIQFEYAPDRSRFRRIDTTASGSKTTLYLGNVEIISLPNGTQQRKRYLPGAIETSSYSAGVLNSRVTNYVFNDHLGSIDVITDAVGNIVEEQSFDAWGKRRGATDWLALTQPQIVTIGNNSVTTRGFTGHEMLDAVGIIHMNGRIYDPSMGRFLQADPFVQDPTNSQSLNRYS